jgi:hypothetical protein
VATKAPAGKAARKTEASEEAKGGSR